MPDQTEKSGITTAERRCMSKPKSRGFIFVDYPNITWNRRELEKWLKRFEDIDCDYLIMQLELCPITKRIHIQGFAYFPTPRTLLGTKRRFYETTHLEFMYRFSTPMKASEYCRKEESRLTGSAAYRFVKGTIPMQGVRTDISDLMEYAEHHTELETWRHYPAAMMRYHQGVRRFQQMARPSQSVMPIVTVFWGRTGCGKSHRCLMGASGSINDLEGFRPYCTMPTPVSSLVIPWIDGYEGHEDVIIEDFDGTINFRIFLRMTDKYRNPMQNKGGFAQMSPKRIWISSNIHPREWYKEEPGDTWGTGPLHRRLTTNGSSIIHLIVPYDTQLIDRGGNPAYI